MKIAFIENSYTFRGSTRALLSYAKANVDVLCNESLILIPHSPKNDCKMIDNVIKKKFHENQIIYFQTAHENLDDILTKHNVDVLYIIKYGRKSDECNFSTKIKTVVHAVFDLSDPHGDVYAGVSHFLARKFNWPFWVDHIIDTKCYYNKGDPVIAQYREMLFPGTKSEDMIIVGRHGAADINLPFVIDLINHITHKSETTKQGKRICFVFTDALVDKFPPNKNLVHLPVIYDDEQPMSLFLSSIDCLIEASYFGHTAGIGILQANVHKKPCLCYTNVNLMWNIAHLEHLDGEYLGYVNKNELHQLLLNFEPFDAADRFSRFNAEQVMEQFKRVFLS